MSFPKEPFLMIVETESMHEDVKSREAYQRLHDWLGDRVKWKADKTRQVKLTIGPRGNYFAQHGSAQLSHALPKDLEKALEKSKSKPMTVALGTKGSWIVLFEDGSGRWDLRSSYPSLASSGHLSNNENRAVFVSLNAYRDDAYFLVKENGAISYSLGLLDSDEAQTVHTMTDTYMRMRAKRDGHTFEHRATVNGVEKLIRIRPNSAAEETRLDRTLAALRARQKAVRYADLTLVASIAGGTGLLARMSGWPTARAVALGALTGGGAALAAWYR